MSLIFNNANIFDGTGNPVFVGSVKVTGNRIVTVSHEPIVGEDDDHVFDATGKTLMPGMIDSHTHLGLGSTVEAIHPPKHYPESESALIIAHAGKVMLEHGFTSGYSAGSGDVKGEIAAAKAFDRGILPGPRLITSSFERLPGGTPGLIFKFPDRKGRESHPESVVAFVNEMADLGVKAVKFLLNGVSALDSGSNMVEQFYEEEIFAAADAARARGLWLTAHCYTKYSIELAVRAGFRALYHCVYADDETLSILEAAKDDIFVGLAPGIVEADLVRGPEIGIMASPEDRAEQADAAERLKHVGQKLRQIGMRSLPGGDYGFPWNPIGRNARDLELFVEWFGYTPAETLHAATAQGAQLMGMSEELGQIAEGFLADLLVINGDPLSDLGILQDKTRIEVIVKDGRRYK